MIIKAIRTRVFKRSEDIISFIKEHIKKIEDNSVVVVTSKIVALMEGRVVKYKNKTQKAYYIKKESQWAIKTKWAWLTIKDGIVMASAGIDESNAGDYFILLPKDSFASADYIRQELMKIYKVKKLGVVITDSRTAPLRLGITGQAIGYAGFSGVKSYIGQNDIFGRPFKFSKVNVADSLAAAAVYEMGEGREKKPLALITSTKVVFKSKVDRNELKISLKDDMYRPFFIKENKCVIPVNFFDYKYNGGFYPGNKKSIKFKKANCQVFIYEILRANGFQIPDFRSSELWEDENITKKVKTLKPFDILLFNKNPDTSHSSHVALYLGNDRIIHLSQKVGHPSVWTMKEFLSQKRYKYFVGAKRLKKLPF